MGARATVRIFLALAGLCLAGTSGVLAARAQNCETCATSQSLLAASAAPWTVRKQVNEVQVFFTASRHGKFVTGLTRDEVAVRDNNRPGEILDFRDQNNLPLRIALLVDTSDSVTNRLRFEKEAAAAFLREVLGREVDQALIAGFATHLHVRQGFTHDSKSLASALGTLGPGGGTALYDAVHAACRLLAGSGHELEARVLIIVSDGDDNESRVSRDEAIALAQQSDTTVYAISTNYVPTEFVGDKNLEQLAEQTGGQALFPGNARNVSHAFARISNELRHRYALAYRPPEFEANGRFRSIRIQARKSGKKLKVKARKGYYAR
jgi:VWFA-related protein